MAADPLKKILFVCVANAARSQMAEALFNAMAPKGMRAVSGGITPASEVMPATQKLLDELGIDARHLKPKPVTRKMMEKADIIVSMGCSIDSFPPEVGSKHVEWPVDGIKGKPLEKARAIRDDIRYRVQNLIATLESG